MSSHTRFTLRIVLETVGLYLAATLLALQLITLARLSWPLYAAYLPILIFQGLLLQRVYIIGHEAAHRKLVPKRRTSNDLLGQALLLPILVPVIIYRKVHMFHHGFNRKDHHTSALDVFVSRWPITPVVRLYYSVLWYLGVFAGGYFLHSLASIIIFLFIPTRLAKRISPAFKGWTSRDRFTAWAQLLVGVAFHLAVAGLFGAQVWFYALGLPFLAFAWVWSLLVYIFHYQTTLGKETRYNVRALDRHWFFSWLLMNFNEHATHHMYPNIPWYELPKRKERLPDAYAARNQTTGSFWRAILHQVKGPTIVYAKDENPTPHLFVRWED
jgi:fatty acid desaturase